MSSGSADGFTPTRIVLIRHGESNVTVDRVVGGPRSCTGLSPLGVRQTERLRERLADSGELSHATALYTSEYPRAIETAEIISPSLDLPVERDARFGEHDPGPACDGLSFSEFVTKFGMPDWDGDPHGVTFPEGETLAAFHYRVGAALSEMVATNPGGVLVIVCHGGVVDVAFRFFLRLPQTGGFELHTVNTSLTEFVQTKPGRWRLARYNDSAHLVGLPEKTERQTSGVSAQETG